MNNHETQKIQPYHHLTETRENLLPELLNRSQTQRVLGEKTEATDQKLTGKKYCIRNIILNLLLLKAYKLSFLLRIYSCSNMFVKI
jgi:hypothetical protein